MTMKELFKKIEAYNEIAKIMGTDKAQIYFADVDPKFGTSLGGEHFDDFVTFRKYAMKVLRQTLPGSAALRLRPAAGQDFTFEWAGGTATYTAELTAA